MSHTYINLHELNRDICYLEHTVDVQGIYVAVFGVLEEVLLYLGNRKKTILT